MSWAAYRSASIRMEAVNSTGGGRNGNGSANASGGQSEPPFDSEWNSQVHGGSSGNSITAFVRNYGGVVDSESQVCRRDAFCSRRTLPTRGPLIANHQPAQYDMTNITARNTARKPIHIEIRGVRVSVESVGMAFKSAHGAKHIGRGAMENFGGYAIRR